MGDRRKRVLFITSGSIGDAILSSGLLRQQVECEPEAWFTVAAGPAAAPLFSDTPRLEDLIVLVKRPYKLHWLDLWRRVWARRWETVIDMRGSGLAYALSARRRRVFLPTPQQDGAPPLHQLRVAARTVGAVDCPPPPFLHTSAATEARADALIDPTEPVLAIAPASTWPPKTWPAERFGELAVELLGRGGPLAGGRLLVTGGVGDRAVCALVRAALPPSRVIDAVGLDLLTTYACFKRVRLFIGNDSGPMHLAAAAGAPTLGLFGPTDDRQYGPWGPRAAVVRSQRPLSAYPALFQAVGFGASVMTDLGVAEVARAACDLLGRTGAATPAPRQAPALDSRPAPTRPTTRAAS